MAKLVALVSGAAIAGHLALPIFLGHSKVFSDVPLYAALIFGGVPLLVILAQRLWLGEFGTDFLAGASIVTAVLLHEYLVATIVILMLSGRDHSGIVGHPARLACT